MSGVSAQSPLAWGEARSRFSARCFDAIRICLEALNQATWPTLKAINQLATNRGLANYRNMPLRFIAPSSDADSLAAVAMHYERRIAEFGEIATRENWHDFFNTLQWLTFPQSKAAISEMHTRLLSAHASEAQARSIPRDVLTLFDEGGVIVASTDALLLELIQNFQWRELFVERRDEVIKHMHFYLVGHSVLEKMLDPYIGITAKAVLFEVDATFAAKPAAAQIIELDVRARDWLLAPENLASTRNLHPLPILGIPGWDARNETADFYDNAHYFRSGRHKDRSTGRDRDR